MSISGILKFLSNLGNTITVTGNLISRLGYAISLSNLESQTPSQDMVRPATSQDPPTQGVKDEKPAVQESFKPTL
jgi:hypothetical protein